MKIILSKFEINFWIPLIGCQCFDFVHPKVWYLHPNWCTRLNFVHPESRSVCPGRNDVLWMQCWSADSMKSLWFPCSGAESVFFSNRLLSGARKWLPVCARQGSFCTDKTSVKWGNNTYWKQLPWVACSLWRTNKVFSGDQWGGDRSQDDGGGCWCETWNIATSCKGQWVACDIVVCICWYSRCLH